MGAFEAAFVEELQDCLHKTAAGAPTMGPSASPNTKPPSPFTSPPSPAQSTPPGTSPPAMAGTPPGFPRPPGMAKAGGVPAMMERVYESMAPSAAGKRALEYVTPRMDAKKLGDAAAQLLSKRKAGKIAGKAHGMTFDQLADAGHRSAETARTKIATMLPGETAKPLPQAAYPKTSAPAPMGAPKQLTPWQDRGSGKTLPPGTLAKSASDREGDEILAVRVRQMSGPSKVIHLRHSDFSHGAKLAMATDQVAGASNALSPALQSEPQGVPAFGHGQGVKKPRSPEAPMVRMLGHDQVGGHGNKNQMGHGGGIPGKDHEQLGLTDSNRRDTPNQMADLLSDAAKKALVKKAPEPTA